jgi:glyoxylase-like metal-dependent hydrolase (beta-lactamase superfamily II)
MRWTTFTALWLLASAQAIAQTASPPPNAPPPPLTPAPPENPPAPAAPPPPSAAAATPAPPRAQPLASDVWWIPGGIPDKRQPDGNTVILQGQSGLIVFDTGRHVWQRVAILEFAASQRQAIEAIVNSHWHLDHVSGNADIKAAFPQAKVYASDAVDAALEGFFKDSARRMQAFLRTPNIPPEVLDDVTGDLATIEHPAALRPDVVIRATQTMTLAGRTIEVHLSKDGPTAGDVWLYDPASKILVAGDLVTLPAPFLDTACTAGWSAALAQIAQVPFEKLVPGHGNPMSRAEFAQYRKAFDAFIACAHSESEAESCASAWARDAATLLSSNHQDPKFTQEMAGYYVGGVLRPNGGQSRYCRSPR